jgi:hypothetical protein
VYLTLLLSAQGDPEGQRRASAARVSWDLQTKNGTPYRSDYVLSADELAQALDSMLHNTFSSTVPLVRKAAASKEAEQKLRSLVAQNALARAEVAKLGKQAQAEDTVFCSQTMGLPTELMPCCLKFVTDVKPGFPHDERYREYKKLVEKQNPSVMACLQNAQQTALTEGAAEEAAKKKKQLIMIAGVVGAVVVGALLLKGKK